MNTKTKVIGGFLLGTAIGAATGLLLAPRSGRKTRKKIKNESKKLADDSSQESQRFIKIS